MKAAQINKYGDPSVIKLVDLPIPVVGPGQLLIEVKASSLNPFDTTIREGHLPNLIKNFPVTLGGDVAGVVISVGEGVHDFAAGDRVFGQANVVAGNSGAFAEYAVTSSHQVAKAPTNLDFIQAASTPLVGVSAIQAIHEHIKLQKGQKILIQGGTGGIGSLVVQLAKNIGAYVAATVSGKDVDIAKRLGIDLVIDFQKQDFTDIIEGYDAVFDTVGNSVFEKSLTVLKKGGIAVSMIANIDKIKNPNGAHVIRQNTQINKEILAKLAKLIEEGALVPQISKTYSLEEIRQAFEMRESGHISGKIAIKI